MSDAAYSLTVEMTRGTGTDDRDKLKATVEAESLEELDERIDEMRSRMEDLAGELRVVQPSEERRTAEGQRALGEAGP